MLSEKIHELRRKSGLSQEELADKLNVSRQAISKWELGSAVPTADKLVDIADFFGVSLDFLMRDLSEIPVSEISEKPENRTPEVHEKPHTARKITAFLLIATAVAMFAMITALYANQELRGGISGSFRLELDGVGIIVLLAAICAAVGASLLISLKK